MSPAAARDRFAATDLDLATWPVVAFTALPQALRERYLRLETAVRRYAEGAPLEVIENETGVLRGSLYRVIRRCVSPHPDGRVHGFRGLLGATAARAYRRRSALAIRKLGGSRGAAGAFGLLLERHPELRQWLTQQIAQRRALVEESGATSMRQLRLRELSGLHARFLDECRRLGLTRTDYPFNVREGGLSTLSRYVKRELLRRFGEAARAAGAEHLKGFPRGEDELVAPSASRPYAVVEFDGHRLDVRLKVVLTDAMGFAHEFEVERLWLLVVLDVCTRAVLGYHVVLAPEYSRFDVIKTVERALAPHRKRTFTLPGLAYPARGGFPSGVRPELAYACWDWFKLDHAKANLAADALAVLTEFVGCAVDAGPVHTPDDRPYIERFFGTIASCLSHRLPGTTGTNPKDLRRRLADPKGDLRLLLAIEELEDLLELAIAYYNGRPHSGLNGRSPLETLEVFLRERDFLPRWLPEPRRRTLCLMQTAKGATVRGGLRSGVRPHVNLWGVRHTNATLAASALYLGTRLLIYYTPEDLREVRAFLPDGSELGILKAQGLWGETPHSLRVRQEILRLRRARQLHYAEHANPISAYVEKLRREAKRSRRSATRLAAALALLKEGALPRVPPGPEALRERPTLPPTPTSSSSTPVVQPVARSPAIVPERLDIGTGVVV